jgi:type I restriction enzyme S subunit
MTFPRYPKYKDSGVEWLGEVPAHWSIHRVRWLCEIRKRIAGELGHDVLSITQQGIKIKDIDSNDGQLSMDYSKYQFLGVGEFAMNHMDLLTGYVDLSPMAGVTSPDYRVFAIRNPALSYDRYLLYLFQMGYKNKIFFAYGQGSSQLGRWRLPTEQFNDLTFPVPPISEQRKIAALLDRETAKIDALIAEQQRLIELLKEKRQAVISHAVTKGLNPDAPMQPSGIEWLGEVPAHWEIGPLKRFADVIDCKHYTVEFLDDGFPIVSIRELRDDKIDLSNAKLTSKVEWGFLREDRAPRYGDMIFCRNASVGAIGYVDFDEPFCMGQDVCLIRPDATSRFMHYQLASVLVRNQIEAFLVGATIRRANVEEIRNLVVAHPPADEQQAIASVLLHETAKIDTLTTEAQRAIDLLQERRTALISAAVTGQIDVRCAEAA